MAEPYGTRVPVEGRVDVLVGPVDLRLYPYNEVRTDVDDYDERPWKWWAMVRLHFRIGELTTTKRVVTAYSFYGSGRWPTKERPTEADLAAGRTAVLDNLRTQVERHGFKCPEFFVQESDYSPSTYEPKALSGRSVGQ